MVKIPQSTLGYVVDGKLWIPHRSPSESQGVTCGQTLTPKKKRKNKNMQIKNKRIPVVPSREACNKLRISPDLEALKNASKQGDSVSACNLTESIADKYFGNRRSNQILIFIARSLVVSDIENRSAVYYAAHSGQVYLVQRYLAILVLARAMRNETKAVSILGKKISIRDWFSHLGHVGCFGPDEVDLCVLNALNVNVKALFKHQKYSLEELRQSVLSSPWGRFIPSQHPSQYQNASRPRARKNKKPVLVMDDEYSAAEDMIYKDFGHNDLIEDLDAGNQVLNEITDHHDLQALSEDEIIMQLYAMMLNDDDAATSKACDLQLVLNQVDQATEGCSLLDDWSEVDESSTDGSFEHCVARCPQPDEDDWSVLSEVASVKSINSITGSVSYSNVLRRATKNANVTPRRTKTTTLIMQTVVEDEAKMSTLPNKMREVSSVEEEFQNSEYDEFFLHEGVKGGHGGKTKLMFKGNQKTAKSLQRKYRGWH